MPVKLYYFNARGLAEVSRYMLTIAGVGYEDFRYPISIDFQRPEFDADSAAGKFRVNMGRIPMLEVDGLQIGQSSTIMRYIARKYGFAGSDEIQEALCDMYCEHVRDIKDAYQRVRSILNEADRRVALDKWFTTDLPEWLDKLEKSIDGAEGFSVGSKLTVSDIAIYYFLVYFFDNKEGAKAAYAACPKLTAIVNTVGQLSAVQEWDAKRPETFI